MPKLQDLKPGERFIIDCFGQGFVIRQDPEMGLTDVFLEVSTHSRAVMALPGSFEIGWAGKWVDPRLEQYQDALTYPEMLRAWEQEQRANTYLLNKLAEAQSRAQAAEARADRLERAQELITEAYRYRDTD